MENEIAVNFKVVNHINDDGTQDEQLNARTAIELMIYVLLDKKLAGPDDISEALEWWSEEIYEVN